MQKKTCFFIGHREAPDSILPVLIDEVERHITVYGVNSFVVGHYGQFDTLAGQAVIEAKKRHPEVSLIMLLPYQNSGRPTIPPEGFDNTFFTPLAWSAYRHGQPFPRPINIWLTTAIF